MSRSRNCCRVLRDAYCFLGQYEQAIAASRTCLDSAKLQPCRETLAAAPALLSDLDAAAAERSQLSEANATISPDKKVARLCPAFRRQSDLDRLLDGLTKAAKARPA